MKTKTNKTKNLRRLALAAALLLILALLLAFDAINGDPLSQQWAIYRAIRYAEKLYPEETFHWDQRTAADGQFFHYVVYVQSDQSRDTNFAVQTRFWLLTDDEIRGMEFEPTHTFYVDHRWNTAYRLGDEAAQQAAAYLTVQAPDLNFASVYGAKGNTVEIDLCYTEQDGMTPANYVDDLPLDAAFDKALLQKVPSRLCAQVLCDEVKGIAIDDGGKPTDADMQTVLHTLKQVLESNGMPITYYDITLVPGGDYADHSAYMADVLESGLVAADTIA